VVSVAAPALLNVFGLKADGAARLLVTAGDNPGRLRSEAAFAALCGSNPVPASTQAYMRRRLAEGKRKPEIMRCLKRYVAREVFGMIRPPAAIQQVTADEAIRAA
jgi:hypothetical protein